MTQTSLQALLALQEIDREIFKVGAELKRLPAELATRRAELDRRSREFEEKKKAQRELLFTIREIENITAQQRVRLRKIESEAMKSKADVALFAAYEHEMRTLKKTIGQADDEGLAFVEQADVLAAEMKILEQSSAVEETHFQELRANIEQEISVAEGRLASLRSSLDARMHGNIPPEHLTLYRGLLATREGEALAALDGRFCQGCFVEIPKNLVVRLARGLDLVQCPSCGRILHTR